METYKYNVKNFLCLTINNDKNGAGYMGNIIFFQRKWFISIILVFLIFSEKGCFQQ